MSNVVPVKILLAALGTAIFVMPTVLVAGPRGITRDFVARYESRDTDFINVSRFQLETDMSWQLDRRSRLMASLPAAWVRSEFGGREFEVSAIKDLRVDYFRDLREAQVGRAGGRLYLGLNLPTGKNELNAEEAAAIDSINASSEGFLSPELGRGFGATVGYGLISRSSPKSSREFNVKYDFRGAYDARENVERDDRDTLTLSIFSHHEPTPRRRTSWGLSAFINSDEDFRVDGIEQPTAQGNADVMATYSHSYDTSPERRGELLLGYIYRGQQDFILATGTPVRNVELGDRAMARYTWSKRLRPGSWLQLGGFAQYTMASRDDNTGAELLNSQRSEAALVLGHVLDLQGYHKLKSNAQFGLTEDSRDLVTTVSYCADF